ncbi:hypothetical protein [Bacillus safensis]|nr:hypothetical protein [Bacillus safensis]MCY7570263.1 hypothetical protein [Bacillus safensis]
MFYHKAVLAGTVKQTITKPTKATPAPSKKQLPSLLKRHTTCLLAF